MIEKAYGKINVSINVLSRREDGYHLVDMVMLPIDLYDVIEIEISDKTEYQCNWDLEYNEKNLIYKAVELLRSEFGFKEQFKIKVTKNIPMQAGLAGGSSNAAATLRLINELCNLNLSLDQLAAYGKRIGADVPFCVYNKPARVQGIGEIITPFELEKGYDVLLIKPDEGVNTGKAYQTLNIPVADHPDIEKLQHALVNHEKMNHLLGNSLMESATRMVPVINSIVNECREAGYDNSLMSGSGSTCFVLTEKGTDTSGLEEKLLQKYNFVMKTSTL